MSRYLFAMRPALLALAVLCAACGGGPPADDSPIGRARAAAGPGHAVNPAGLGVPDAEAFVVVPDPVPPDHDGFVALLVPTGRTDARAEPLRGADALRHVWSAGVRDPSVLAHAAALFVADAPRVGTDEDRARADVRHGARITPPALTARRSRSGSSAGA